LREKNKYKEEKTSEKTPENIWAVFAHHNNDVRSWWNLVHLIRLSRHSFLFWIAVLILMHYHVCSRGNWEEVVKVARKLNL